MKTSCDACGKEAIYDYYTDAPATWFSSLYRDDTVLLSIDNMTVSVPFNNRNFCSSKCVCDYFTQKLLDNLAAAIEAGMAREEIENKSADYADGQAKEEAMI